MKTYNTVNEILQDLADGYTIVYNENPDMKTYVAERGLSKAYLFTNPSHWHREENNNKNKLTAEIHKARATLNGLEKMIDEWGMK